MKKISFSLLVLCLTLVACQEENKGDGVYYNDFESMGYWSDSPKLKKGIAHSGVFSMFNDGNTEYSEGFKIPLGDIKVAKPRTVIATAWVMSNDLNSKSQFVLNLDSAGKSIAWNGVQTQTVIQEPGKWFEISCSITLPENTTPDMRIFMFGWYGGKGTVYYDDVLLKVE